MDHGGRVELFHDRGAGDLHPRPESGPINETLGADDARHHRHEDRPDPEGRGHVASVERSGHPKATRVKSRGGRGHARPRWCGSRAPCWRPPPRSPRARPAREDRRNNRPICVVGGVLVWPLSGSLPSQAWTISGRFDAIGRPCDRISVRASVFRTATARHNQVEELDRREPFLILPFRPREMFSAFACCYPAQEPGATKWCRPRDSRMHPLP